MCLQLVVTDAPLRLHLDHPMGRLDFGQRPIYRKRTHRGIVDAHAEGCATRGVIVDDGDGFDLASAYFEHCITVRVLEV